PPPESRLGPYLPARGTGGPLQFGFTRQADAIGERHYVFHLHDVLLQKAFRPCQILGHPNDAGAGRSGSRTSGRASQSLARWVEAPGMVRCDRKIAQGCAVTVAEIS